MSSQPPQDASSVQPLGSRSVLLFCLIAILNHLALTGGRVTVSLTALSQGASSFTVGALIALFALLPMLLLIHAGRWVDRIGVRKPIWICGSLVVLGTLLPFAWPNTRVLFVSSAMIGIGCMVCMVAFQNLMGLHTTSEQRVVNFSRLSVSMSISGASGPMIAGLAIDHLGMRLAFGVLVLCPMLALLLFSRLRHKLPPPSPAPARAEHADVRDLFKNPMLRLVLAATVLLSGAWDLNAFMVPLYGTSIGLSATTIGFLLATFGVATFVIRLLLPWIQRHITPWALVRAAMFSAAAVFALYPFCERISLLLPLSFVLGLALGSCQPSLMALLHTYAPRGRGAEAFGLRMAMINGGQFTVPLVFGALSSLGMVLPYMLVAAWLVAGGIFNQPRRHRRKR